MSNRTKYINAKRRGFMQGSVVAGGAAATAVATGNVNAAVSDIAEQDTPAKNAGHAGYRLTDKVRRYYQRARF